MIHPIWRLSEYTPDNLGLACTDDGLLLGRTPLIERRDGRFVVRERGEIARLLKYAFPQGLAVDRIMPGLATVASALNANDQALARIAAVHLQIPDLPSTAARNAMVAEDALIKYARDEGGDSNWNPAVHPRAGVPPNPGWFATTGGPQDGSSKDASSGGQSRVRLAANEDGSRQTDAAPAGDDRVTPQHGNPFDEPANFTDRFGSWDQPGNSEFWSKVWPSIRSWLEEPVPEHDLESGEVVGERPRWRAIAPYLGIPVASASIFGLEAFAPTIAAWLGLGGGATAPVGSGAVVPIGNAAYSTGSIRMVAGYEIGGNAGLVGSTYNINVWGLYLTEESLGLRALAEAFRAEARAAGASNLSIVGSNVLNANIANISPTLAARFGFSVLRINPNTILL